jgi:hypothetical protein
MANPLKFIVRLVYQSIKLLLRIVFILAGGLLTGLEPLIKEVAASQSEHSKNHDEYDVFGCAKEGLPINLYTGELRDW